jgi:hypothetical protein
MIGVFQPETGFKWQRELVRRKWTHPRPAGGGRQRTTKELERLVVRQARENRDWGKGKIEGQLAQLGFELSDETLGIIPRQHGLPLAPKRGGSPSWRHRMTHSKDQRRACDFFHR